MLPDRRVVVAQLRAHDDLSELALVPPDKRERQMHVALGDPQAPLDQFFRILDLNGLLADDGRLRPEVGLISMGDHFDWGTAANRAQATEEGTMLLSWLAAHPPDQIQIIFGNHDLVRVGELSAFSDDEFIIARAAAENATTPALQTAFREKYPSLASPDVITRDFSCFEARQRELVARLLRRRRARLAVAPAGDLLFVHAGLTMDDLATLEVGGRSATAIAHALNRFLDDRVAGWNGEGPLDLSPLHEMGSAKSGEARGIVSHRPANPAKKKVGRDQRRFDPRALPRITQVIGHINDTKCREALGEWCESPRPVLGRVRSLAITAGDQVSYRLGCGENDALIFLDGAMNQVEPADYELFDLELRQPLSLTRSSPSRILTT